MRWKISVILIILVISLLFGISPVMANPSTVCQLNDAENYGLPVQVAVSDDGSGIITGSPSSGIVAFFDRDGKSLWAYKTNQSITNVAISGDGTYVSAASVNGGVSFFNNSGTLLWNFSKAGCFPQVRLAPSGSRGLIFNRNNPDRPFDQNLHMFDLNGSMSVEQKDPLIVDAGISNDSKFVVISWGKKSETLVEYTDSGSHDLGYPAPGYRTAISGDRKTITILSPQEIDAYNREGNRISVSRLNDDGRSVAVSSDGNMIVAGTQNDIESFAGTGSLLWSFRTGIDVASVAVSSHGGNVVALALPGKEPNPTFGRIYYLSGTGKHLWNVTVPDHMGSLALSHDGSIIAAGSFNDTVYVISSGGEAHAMHLSNLSVEPIPTPLSHQVFYFNLSITPSNPAPVSMMGVVLAIGIAAAIVGRITDGGE